ncbi:MAG TPA: hypothetical protein VFO38_04720 [Candidatus Saccharimonadales bacterium]|nr:hypothetical protein [Candidatus Saccharimonadales bacterium]
MENTVCYLIGGAARTGKTTMANELAVEHGIKPFCTDSLHVMLTKLVRRQDNPDLFYTHDLSVEQFYEKNNTPQKALEATVKAALASEYGFTVFIERILPSWQVMVIEGTLITPGFVSRLRQKYPDTTFEATFLYDDNLDRIRDRIYTHGLYYRTPYSDNIKPKEVAYVQACNDWYKKEAKRYKMELIHIL